MTTSLFFLTLGYGYSFGRNFREINQPYIGLCYFKTKANGHFLIMGCQAQFEFASDFEDYYKPENVNSGEYMDNNTHYWRGVDYSYIDIQRNMSLGLSAQYYLDIFKNLYVGGGISSNVGLYNYTKLDDNRPATSILEYYRLRSDFAIYFNLGIRYFLNANSSS